MNKERRKKLVAIREALDAELTGLREVAEAERDAFDAMPEGLQNSQRGEAAGETADTLEDLVGRLDEVCSDLGAIE